MIIDPYAWTRLPIAALDRVTDDTLAVSLHRPTSYLFVPGQYAIIRVTLPGGERLVRQYSYSLAPQSSDIGFLVQREPAGAVSGWFHSSARVGAMLEISQPLGSFTLANARQRPVVLIAGKVGVTPYLSMLRTGVRRATLIYSVKTTSQLCYPAELTRYNCHILTTETSPRIDSSLLAPYVGDSPVWYVCGSKQFVDAICLLLQRLLVAPADIRRELFTLQ